MKEGRKPEYPEKTPGDDLQKKSKSVRGSVEERTLDLLRSRRALYPLGHQGGQTSKTFTAHGLTVPSWEVVVRGEGRGRGGVRRGGSHSKTEARQSIEEITAEDVSQWSSP